MQKNLVKFSYLAQKVLQRGRVPVLQLVDLPSIPTKNNGRKMPIFVPPCILPSHTGFKNIFMEHYIRIGYFFFGYLKTCASSVCQYSRAYREGIVGEMGLVLLLSHSVSPHTCWYYCMQQHQLSISGRTCTLSSPVYIGVLCMPIGIGGS